MSERAGRSGEGGRVGTRSGQLWPDFDPAFARESLPRLLPAGPPPRQVLGRRGNGFGVHLPRRRLLDARDVDGFRLRFRPGGHRLSSGQVRVALAAFDEAVQP